MRTDWESVTFATPQLTPAHVQGWTARAHRMLEADERLISLVPGDLYERAPDEYAYWAGHGLLAATSVRCVFVAGPLSRALGVRQSADRRVVDTNLSIVDFPRWLSRGRLTSARFVTSGRHS